MVWEGRGGAGVGCTQAGKEVMAGVWPRSPFQEGLWPSGVSPSGVPEMQRGTSFLGPGHILPGAVYTMTSRGTGIKAWPYQPKGC